MLDTVHQRVQQTGETVIRAVAQSIARSVAGTAVYVVVFLILLVLLWLLMKPLNAIVTRLPRNAAPSTAWGARPWVLYAAALLLFVAVWAMQRFGWLLTPELIGQHHTAEILCNLYAAGPSGGAVNNLPR